MATYDELRDTLRDLSGLYGQDGWRRLLSPQDVRTVDGYLGASVSTDRYEQSPTGQWIPSTGSSGQLGYLDSTGTFYPALAQSTGDNPQVPDRLVGLLRNIYDEALRGGPLTLPGEPFLRTDEQQRGDAVNAIKALERAMVRQQDEVADADLSLAEAVMRAHSTAEAGNQQLDALQKKIDDYIRAHPGLDTPAGAREFQRFLIGVMDEIRDVVTNGSLDARSVKGILKSLLSAYQPPEESPQSPAPTDDTSAPSDESESEPTGGQQDSPSSTGGSPGGQTQTPAAPSDDMLDELMGSDPGVLADCGPAADTGQSPAMSSLPSLGGMGMPSGTTGATPTSSSPSGLPSLPNLFGGNGSESDGLSDLLSGDEPLLDDEISDEAVVDQEGEEPAEEEGEGTVVHLPNGETVTAPNPQVAAAITAAATGTPVVEAYRLNGMTISPVGTPVADPVDEADLTTGDIGVFSDHHVIALGDSKALVNTSVQPVADVTGPGFLGWEHPPAVRATSPTDAGSGPTVPAAPTRVAATG